MVYFVDLHFAIGAVHLRFIDRHVLFSWKRAYGFQHILQGTHEKKKVRNCCRICRPHISVVAYSYFGTAGGLDLGSPLLR